MPPKRIGKPEDEMAAKSKKTEAKIEKAEAVLRRSEYDTDQPTLVVTAKLSDSTSAGRESRAIAFRAAAEIEMALARANDKGWLVNPPHWGDERRLPDGYRVIWGIALEGCDGAQAEVAMKALAEVAELLSCGKGARR